MNTPTTGEIRPNPTQATPEIHTATALSRVQPVNLDALPNSYLLTPVETGAILGVALQTLSTWRCTGRYDLKFIKSGRKVFYKAGDLRAFLERRTHTHTSQQGGKV